METIEMYVSTTLHGSAKRTGKVMYTLRMKMGEKQYYEKPAEIGKADGTANRLVLWSICRALERMQGKRTILIHTENTYVASVINQRWVETWERNDWKNSRGNEIKDADLWKQILEKSRKMRHDIAAVAGQHEYSDAFAYNMGASTGRDGAQEITAAVGGTAPTCIRTQKVFRPDYRVRHMRHGQMYFRSLPRWE